ncbi:MAG: dihydrolipoamide acetyltransferase family protein [Bacillota bacterium]
MATAVIMPRQGQSVESCVISRWHKKPGDPVRIGDLLFSYETDKAAFDEAAKDEGTLLAVFFQEGDDIPVLTNVCVIGAPGEDISPYKPENPISPPEEKSGKAAGTAAPTGITPPETGDFASGEIKISPRARKRAEKTGLDMRCARPSGPGGRIIERDIMKLYESGPRATFSARRPLMQVPPGIIEGSGLAGRITARDVQSAPAVSVHKGEGDDSPYRDIPLSNIRRVIARAMLQSMSTTAQVTLHSSFDASRLLAARRRMKESGGCEAGITISDMILLAVSRTLTAYPPLNAHLNGETLRSFRHVHLGVAVDTGRGLMVPTLLDADMKTLIEISVELKNLAMGCRQGTINPELLRGASFTVTNLGMLGVESFTPVLNAPQTGILGVNGIIERPREKDGRIELYPSMGLSLTFDHRALDGAPAARFLGDLKAFLENLADPI